MSESVHTWEPRVGGAIYVSLMFDPHGAGSRVTVTHSGPENLAQLGTVIEPTIK